MHDESSSCQSRTARDTRGERRRIESLVREARDHADHAERMRLFREAFLRARQAGEPELQHEALACMVLFNIGCGHSRELVCLFWPFFARLDAMLDEPRWRQDPHLLLWAAERVLYFAPDFPEIPIPELERATSAWLAALARAGGYERKASIRMQLHHALRLGWLEKARPLMRSLEIAEPESELRPSPGSLPGVDRDSGDGGRGTDFGCNAYSNQIRVLFHCATGDARAAWRCARYLVESRSACELALCAMAPREALAFLLDPLHASGMHAEASRAHELGLPMVERMPQAAGWLGHHLRHMVCAGSLKKARSLLDRCLHSPMSEATPFHRFHFLRGALAVIRADGRKDEHLVTLAAEAANLAGKFDVRNSGEAFTRALAKDAQALPIRR